MNKKELLAEIEKIDESTRLHVIEIDKNGVEKNRLVRLLWDVTGGFQEGDKVISKHGERGIVSELRLYMCGNNLGHHSMIKPYKKDGTLYKTGRRMSSWEEWVKE